MNQRYFLRLLHAEATNLTMLVLSRNKIRKKWNKHTKKLKQNKTKIQIFEYKEIRKLLIPKRFKLEFVSLLQKKLSTVYVMDA